MYIHVMQATVIEVSSYLATCNGQHSENLLTGQNKLTSFQKSLFLCQHKHQCTSSPIESVAYRGGINRDVEASCRLLTPLRPPVHGPLRERSLSPSFSITPSLPLHRSCFPSLHPSLYRASLAIHLSIPHHRPSFIYPSIHLSLSLFVIPSFIAPCVSRQNYIKFPKC